MKDVLASLRIREILMVPYKMFLIPGVILDFLVVLEVAKHHLAEAVVVGNIRHLRVHDLVHKFARFSGVVDLASVRTFLIDRVRYMSSRKDMVAVVGARTTVHLRIPYLIIRSFVSGAECSIMCLR